MKEVQEAKLHIEELAGNTRRFASDLAASRRALASVRHERSELRERVSEAEMELGAIQARMEESRHKMKRLVEERRALRQDVVTARGQLSRAHVRVSTLQEQLEQVMRERDAAYSELEEATCALVDIREQLKASLQSVEARDRTSSPFGGSSPSAA